MATFGCTFIHCTLGRTGVLLIEKTITEKDFWDRRYELGLSGRRPGQLMSVSAGLGWDDETNEKDLLC